MTIGQLRDRVTLQAPTGTTGYVDQATVWAAIEFTGGSERLRSGGPESTGDYMVTMRHRTDVRSEWRLTAGTRTWQVAAYGDPDGRREWVRLYCQELL